VIENSVVVSVTGSSLLDDQMTAPGNFVMVHSPVRLQATMSAQLLAVMSIPQCRFGDGKCVPATS
jgi:hypothetical protein